jgi:hypothetical protein
LRHLVTLSPMPWLCMGDFNEILNLTEKWEASTRGIGQMEKFQRMLEDCHLCDSGFKGFKYTWNNGRHDGEFTKEILDRAVTSTEWRMMFDAVVVEVLANRSLDHHPPSSFDKRGWEAWKEKTTISVGGELGGKG